MSFNAHTYYANKYGRKAWEELSAARVHRDLGHAVERVQNSVKLARSYMRIAMSNRRLRQMQKDHRR